MLTNKMKATILGIVLLAYGTFVHQMRTGGSPVILDVASDHLSSNSAQTGDFSSAAGICGVHLAHVSQDSHAQKGEFSVLL